MRRIFLSKKGISLAECLAAILIVSIVAASGITIFSTASNAVLNRWDKYRAVATANNALSIFRASESAPKFSSDVSTLLEYSDPLATNEQTKQITSTESYTEYDLSKSMKATALGKIMTNEGTKKVGIYKGTDTSPCIEFDYSSQSDYNSDKSYLDNNSYLATDANKDKYFEKTVENEKSLKVNMISEGTPGTESTSYYAENSMQYIITKTKTYLKYAPSLYYSKRTNARNLTSKEYNTTPIEKYFLEKSCFLMFNKNSAFSNNYIYAAVFQIDGNGKITQYTENSKFVYIRLKYSSAPTAAWDSDTTGYTITEVYKSLSGSKCTTTSNTSDITKDTDNSYYGYNIDSNANLQTFFNGGTQSNITTSISSSSFKWPHYPKYFYDKKDYSNYRMNYLLNKNFFADKLNDGTDSISAKYEYSGSKFVIRSYKSTDFPEGATCVINTPLKVNYRVDTGNTASDILYAVSKNTSTEHWIKLYNSNDVILYQYNSSSDISSKISDLRTAFGFDQKYDSANETDNTTKHRNLSADMSANKVVVGYDTTNAEWFIQFNNGSTKIARFAYKLEALYSVDLETLKTGAFKDFYTKVNNTNYTLKQPGGVFVQFKNSAYDVIIKYNQSGVDKENKVFTSHSTLFSTNDKIADKETDDKLSEITSTVDCGAITTAYSCVIGRYACFMVTTFSEMAYDTSVEPQIKIWVMKKNELPTNSRLGALYNEAAATRASKWNTFINSLGTPYISYKKG